MSFWSSTEGQITGDPAEFAMPELTDIPDGTKALAVLDAFVIKQFENEKFYQINWKITDGPFKNRVVFQKLKVFSEDSNKRHRALNLLMYLYKLFGFHPPQDEPKEHELRGFIGSHAGITIKRWEFNGKTGNWVSEVENAQGFQPKTGVGTKPSLEEQRPLYDNSSVEPNNLDDDLPF